MGITISAKCAGAVRRNRLKRVIRERYRTNKERFPGEGLLLFLVRDCNDEAGLLAEIPRLVERAVKIAISHQPSAVSHQKPESRNRKPSDIG